MAQQNIYDSLSITECKKHHQSSIFFNKNDTIILSFYVFKVILLEEKS